MIRPSILITTDPGVFCPDVRSLYSVPGHCSFRRLTSGSHDTELSSPGKALPQTGFVVVVVIHIAHALAIYCVDIRRRIARSRLSRP